MFVENLAPYFEAFGCPVTFGNTKVSGILDMPGDVVLGHIVSDDYMLTFQTGQLPGLKNGSALTIVNTVFGMQPTGFVVRDVRKHGDGALSIAFLSRSSSVVIPPPPPPPAADFRRSTNSMYAPALAF